MIKAIILLLFASFTLNGQLDSIKTTNPEYPGGNEALARFIRENLVYPQTAARDKIYGRCLIKFTIDVLGNPINIAVSQSLRGDCDTAAINVVKLLTGWKPGTLMGRKVRAYMTLPIAFNPPTSSK